MTQIGTITVTVPMLYRRRGYDCNFTGYMEDEDLFNQMRELFAKTDTGTAIQPVPGERPYGEDLTLDSRNTQLCVFTSGTSGKPQDGYYLLRPSFMYVEDETPRGYTYVFDINLFYLGSDAFYSAAYSVVDLDVLDSDWGI